MFSSKDVNVNLLNSQSLEATGKVATTYWRGSGGKIRVIEGKQKETWTIEAVGWNLPLIIGLKEKVQSLSFLCFYRCASAYLLLSRPTPKPLSYLLKSDNIFFNYILPCFQMWHI